MNIEATDVTKTYGDVTALEELSLSVPSGSVFGLLGTNGAGKTTLFRLLIGHETPDAGTVRIGERTVGDAGTAIRRRIGYLPERVGFPDELTAREVLAVTARIRGLADTDERVDAVLETVGLAADADRPVSGFSNGMRRRLGLAVALLPDPAVLLLDEPTAGLDPLGVVTFHRIVEDVSERTGATVIVCSHALDEVERLCDRAAILDDGRLRAAGSLADLAAGSPDARTVRVSAPDGSRRAAAREVCAQFGDPTVRNGTVTVAVPTDDARALVDALATEVGLEGVELGAPGLESTFASLLSEDGSGSTATAAGRAAAGLTAAERGGSP
jgi:Cu-processing system ATP-binding protein